MERLSRKEYLIRIADEYRKASGNAAEQEKIKRESVERLKSVYMMSEATAKFIIEKELPKFDKDEYSRLGDFNKDLMSLFSAMVVNMDEIERQKLDEAVQTGDWQNVRTRLILDLKTDWLHCARIVKDIVSDAIISIQDFYLREVKETMYKFRKSSTSEKRSLIGGLGALKHGALRKVKNGLGRFLKKKDECIDEHEKVIDYIDAKVGKLAKIEDKRKILSMELELRKRKHKEDFERAAWQVALDHTTGTTIPTKDVYSYILHGAVPMFNNWEKLYLDPAKMRTEERAKGKTEAETGVPALIPGEREKGAGTDKPALIPGAPKDKNDESSKPEEGAREEILRLPSGKPHVSPLDKNKNNGVSIDKPTIIERIPAANDDGGTAVIPAGNSGLHFVDDWKKTDDSDYMSNLINAIEGAKIPEEWKKVIKDRFEELKRRSEAKNSHAKLPRIIQTSTIRDVEDDFDDDYIDEPFRALTRKESLPFRRALAAQKAEEYRKIMESGDKQLIDRYKNLYEEFAYYKQYVYPKYKSKDRVKKSTDNKVHGKYDELGAKQFGDDKGIWGKETDGMERMS